MNWRNVLTVIGSVFGLFFVLSGFIVYFFFNNLIQHITIQRMMLSEDSETYKGWKETNVPIYTKFYFFNITNSNEILNNNSRPHLQQLGPYTWREQRIRVNVSWNHQNGTVEYQQVRRWFFEPDLTEGSLEDKIINLNMAMVGGANDVLRNPELTLSLNDLIDELGSELFLKNTIKELVFEGFENELMTVGKQWGFSVPYDKFGWFYTYNNTVRDGTYRIFTGESGTANKFGLLNLWNKMESLPYYKSELCNNIQSATTGDFSPLFQDSIPKIIPLFVGDLCRTFPLTQLSQVNYGDVKVNRYWLNERTFDYRNAENQCYCTSKEGCPPNGLFDASACKFDSPIFISFPHLLFGDQSLLKSLHGLNPDPGKHLFYVDVDPVLGLFVNGKFRLQVNTIVRQNEELDFAYHLNNLTYYPLFWTETSFQIGEDILSNVRLLHKIPYYSTIAAFILLIIGGSILLYVLIYTLRIHQLKKLMNRTTSRPKNFRDYKPTPDDHVNGQNVNLCSTSFTS